jgi:hypothetical protein
MSVAPTEVDLPGLNAEESVAKNSSELPSTAEEPHAS